MEETISLKEIFETLKKRLWMIILITALATIVSGLVSYLMLTPVYQAKTQILVQSETNQNQVNYSQLQANLELVNTYSVLIKSPRILDQVVDQLNLDQTSGQLQGELSVSSEQNSQVLNIAVTNPSPKKAAEIANTIANVFKSQVVNIMNVDNVTILSKADLDANPQPVKPNPKLNMAIAFVVGLMIGIGIAFLLEYLDNTIKSEEDVEGLLELPLLGAVAEIEAEEKAALSQTAKRRTRSETFGA